MVTTEVAADGTPCGEPSVTACPGPDVTLSTHDHKGRQGSGQAGALPSKLRASGFPAVGSWVAKPGNWCAECQRTLLFCYHAGCRRAAEQVTIFAYLASLSAVQGERTRRVIPWSATEEEIAEKAARRKVMSRLEGKPGDPSEWNIAYGPAGTLVSWLSSRGGEEIRAEIKDRMERRSSPVHNERLLSALKSGDGEDVRGEEDSWTSSSPGPDEISINREEARELQGILRQVFNLILATVRPLESRGAAPSCESLMLIYLTDFRHRRRLYSDNSYGLERRSDRAIAMQVGIPSNHAAIDRTRTEVLIPAIRSLLSKGVAASSPGLTPRHQAAIQSVVDFLENRPMTYRVSGSDGPKRVTAATTDLDTVVPSTNKVGDEGDRPSADGGAR